MRHSEATEIYKKCSCGHKYKPCEKTFIGEMGSLKLYNCPKCKSTNCIKKAG